MPESFLIEFPYIHAFKEAQLCNTRKINGVSMTASGEAKMWVSRAEIETGEKDPTITLPTLPAAFYQKMAKIKDCEVKKRGRNQLETLNTTVREHLLDQNSHGAGVWFLHESRWHKGQIVGANMTQVLVQFFRKRENKDQTTKFLELSEIYKDIIRYKCDDDNCDNYWFPRYRPNAAEGPCPDCKFAVPRRGGTLICVGVTYAKPSLKASPARRLLDLHRKRNPYRDSPVLLRLLQEIRAANGLPSEV